jgi:hypothetical protein
MNSVLRKRLLSGVLLAGIMSSAGLAHASVGAVETCRAATTLATNLGLIRGHLSVAAELFEAGHFKLAQRHSKHPAEEVYQELLPSLAHFELPGFDAELAAFADVLAAGAQGRALFRDSYARLITTMTALESQLPLNERQFQRVAFELVSQAAVEYAVGVAEDGEVTDLQEYQDAYGFVTIAKGKVVDETAVATGQLASAFTAALRLWPTLMPQGPLSTESADLAQLVALMRQQGMAAPACD